MKEKQTTKKHETETNKQPRNMKEKQTTKKHERETNNQET